MTHKFLFGFIKYILNVIKHVNVNFKISYVVQHYAKRWISSPAINLIFFYFFFRCIVVQIAVFNYEFMLKVFEKSFNFIYLKHTSKLKR